MCSSRCYENLSKIDYEDKENKKTVDIEEFCYKVLLDINGVKYLYNDLLIGAIDGVSYKYNIKCKENIQEVFIFINNKLRELGWQ